jgi:hypothetical protein
MDGMNELAGIVPFGDAGNRSSLRGGIGQSGSLECEMTGDDARDRKRRSEACVSRNHDDLPARVETAGFRWSKFAGPHLSRIHFCPELIFSHVYPTKVLHSGLKASHAKVMYEVCPSERHLRHALTALATLNLYISMF